MCRNECCREGAFIVLPLSRRNIIVGITCVLIQFAMAGCGVSTPDHSKPVTQSNQTAQSSDENATSANRTTANAMPSTDTIPEATLQLPNHHVIRGEETAYRYKDLSLMLHLFTTAAAHPYSYSLVGNHSQIIFQRYIHVPAGRAYFALNERTQPAAAQSSAVTYEYWIAIYRHGYDYAVEGIVIGNRHLALGEMLQLVQGWKVPK